MVFQAVKGGHGDGGEWQFGWMLACQPWEASPDHPGRHDLET